MRPKLLSWDEALRLNGKPGYTPKDALDDRAKALESLYAARPPVVRQWVTLQRDRRSCDHHGDYEACLEQLTPSTLLNKPLWTKCPRCDSEIAEEQRICSASAAEMKKAVERMRLVNAGIPDRCLDSDFWNYQHRIPAMDRVWQQLRDYADDLQLAIEVGRCAVLHGSHGTGKTHLACAVLRNLLLKFGGTGFYITQGRFISRLKATMDKGAAETEQQVYAALSNYDLLVVDEIGRGGSSPWERSALFRLIDERYQRRCRPTMIVSNLSLGEMAAEVDQAGLDRMKENGGIKVHFNWDSQRATKP